MTRRQMLRFGLIGSAAPLTVAFPSRAGAAAEPDLCRDDVAIDDATAMLFSREAPLVPGAGLRDARAVWSRVPGRPDRGVLIYLHGHNGYVTVDATGRPRVPDWAAGDESVRQGASSKPPAPWSTAWIAWGRGRPARSRSSWCRRSARCPRARSGPGSPPVNTPTRSGWAVSWRIA